MAGRRHQAGGAVTVDVEPVVQLRELVAAGMSDPAIARRLGVSSRTVLRWRQREGLSSQWQPELPAHGTVARYHATKTRPGCHCDDCRAANTAAMRQYVAQLRDRVPATERRSTSWTPADDAVLLAGDGTLADRARQLGRTYAAAKRRLDRLRREQPP